MEREEAQEIASRMLSYYALPEEERITAITGVVCIYGKSDGNQIITKQAAEGMAGQINEHPEKFPLVYNNAPFVAKRAWLEGDEVTGKVMVEYVRNGGREQL